MDRINNPSIYVSSHTCVSENCAECFIRRPSTSSNIHKISYLYLPNYNYNYNISSSFYSNSLRNISSSNSSSLNNINLCDNRGYMANIQNSSTSFCNYKP